MHSHSRPPATTRVIAARPDEAPGLPPGQTWNDRLKLLLESTGEGIFGIDNAGLCSFVNRAACELLGHGTEQVLGRNMHELIHHTTPTAATTRKPSVRSSMPSARDCRAASTARCCGAPTAARCRPSTRPFPSWTRARCRARWSCWST